ncbi:MAG: RNA polymerase sigma factor [candidate division KSB1 bacterium]|nr:RNA polymerase sigma factor [candidate division KSB1 bacterium]
MESATTGKPGMDGRGNEERAPLEPLGTTESTSQRPDEEDGQLMIRAAAGDRWAYDRLVRRYYRKVYATSYRILGSSEDAADATQEIFLKVYSAASSFRPELRFSTWLYRICLNHCLNVLRWRKRRRWLSLNALLRSQAADEEGDELASLFRDVAAGPDELVEKNERAEAVRKAIESLPEKQRIAVILHRYEGLNYREIAEVMGTSVASVESRLHRAKLALAEKLAELLELPSTGPAAEASPPTKRRKD